LQVANIDTFNYYKALISLRKTKDIFTLDSTADIADSIVIIPDQQTGFVSFFLNDPTDDWKTTYVLHNNGDESREVMIHPGTWNVVVTTDEIDSALETLYVQEGGEVITIAKNETLVMYSTETVEFISGFNVEDDTPIDNNNSNSLLIPLIAVGVIAVAGVSALVIKRKFS
jgi:pullulanase/glycogen debranching enzyme